MRTLLTTLLLAFPASALALPIGPVASVGLSVTGTKIQDGVTFDPFVGPTFRLGLEMGDRFNNEFGIQVTRGAGTATDRGIVGEDFSFLTVGAGYALTIDILRKAGFHGFTPYVGAGFYLGEAKLTTDARVTDAATIRLLGSDFAQHEERTVIYLELHAQLGVRYTLSNGLGFKAELAYSTYGGFGALQPSLAIAYRF